VVGLLPTSSFMIPRGRRYTDNGRKLAEDVMDGFLVSHPLKMESDARYRGSPQPTGLLFPVLGFAAQGGTIPRKGGRLATPHRTRLVGTTDTK